MYQDTTKRPNKAFTSLEDVSAVLEDIRSFNENLFLLPLTYGCLLRPHREIRQLTWGDFSDELTFISLSGIGTRAGGIELFQSHHLCELLKPKERHLNIFSSSQPHSTKILQDALGTLQSPIRDHTTEQTLYSFRHTGAIDVFKRTGSLTVLQQAMGHASWQ